MLTLSWCGGSIQVTSNAWWDRSHDTPPVRPPHRSDPPGQTPPPPRSDTPQVRPPWVRHPSRSDTPPGQTPPGQTHPPTGQTHPQVRDLLPPPPIFFFLHYFVLLVFLFFQKFLINYFIICSPPPTTDGQSAGGTHPTGMHSCYIITFELRVYANLVILAFLYCLNLKTGWIEKSVISIIIQSTMTNANLLGNWLAS